MTQNRILAAIALFLAAGALITGTPERNSTGNTSALAAMIETERDHIAPLDLARTMKGKVENIRLIDLRDSLSYEQYHIPGAESMTLTKLVNGAVHRNENIVLYSQGGTHAAQAWVLLESKNYSKVRTLLGGIRGWNDEVMHPDLRFNGDQNRQKEIEERRILSLFFGGSPRMDSSATHKKQKLMPQMKQPLPELEEEKLRETC